MLLKKLKNTESAQLCAATLASHTWCFCFSFLKKGILNAWWRKKKRRQDVLWPMILPEVPKWNKLTVQQYKSNKALFTAGKGGTHTHTHTYSTLLDVIAHTHTHTHIYAQSAHCSLLSNLWAMAKRARTAVWRALKQQSELQRPPSINILLTSRWCCRRRFSLIGFTDAPPKNGRN